MKPMFSYFGSKYLLARRYAKPAGRVIEPFAGSACYSLYWDAQDAHLYDVNPVICGVWDFLIHASSQDVLNLPLDFDHIDDVKASQEAKWFIGFGLSLASTAPSNVISSYTKVGRANGHASGWTEKHRFRVSEQVNNIRDWRITNASYTDCPDVKATWFIDPPYMEKGKLYPYHDIDREQLARFCWSRQGLTIVCDDPSADYLPFSKLAEIRGAGLGGKKRSIECVWERDSG